MKELMKAESSPSIASLATVWSEIVFFGDVKNELRMER